jgi:hypothetical protein
MVWIYIVDVYLYPFELLCGCSVWSIKPFRLNIHCIVGVGLDMRLTVRFKDMPIFKRITSSELGMSSFNRGWTEMNKNKLTFTLVCADSQAFNAKLVLLLIYYIDHDTCM